MHDVASRGSPRAHIRQATFELDHDLYRAIRVEAARADRPVREVVQEALEAWLARAEELEDRDSAAAALAEYQQDGGEAADGSAGWPPRRRLVTGPSRPDADPKPGGAARVAAVHREPTAKSRSPIETSPPSRSFDAARSIIVSPWMRMPVAEIARRAGLTVDRVVEAASPD
jgi:plasmid stability protein